MSDDGISNMISYFKSWGEKFKPTIECMKADFLEIKDCVLSNTDSNIFIQDTTNLAKKHVIDNLYEGASFLKNGVNSLVQSLSSSTTEDIPEEFSWDKKKAMLQQIQSSNNTFLHNYSDDDDYLNWEQEYDVSLYKEKIEGLLKNEVVKTKLDSLVPGKIEEDLFWKHYFYKIYMAEQEEIRRQALLQRAATTLKEDLAWDGNEDDWELASIPSPSSHTSTPEIVSQDGQIENDKKETKKETKVSERNKDK